MTTSTTTPPSAAEPMTAATGSDDGAIQVETLIIALLGDSRRRVHLLSKIARSVRRSITAFRPQARVAARPGRRRAGSVLASDIGANRPHLGLGAAGGGGGSPNPEPRPLGSKPVGRVGTVGHLPL